MRREYTPDEDDRIMEAILIADEMGVPKLSVFTKLADELDRTAAAVNKRYQMLRHLGDHEPAEYADEQDEDDNEIDVLSRLKALVKERDYYKARYEAAEAKAKDYDRLARELRQIRRVLGE